jgi:Tfp pilus assembly protein PilN
LFIGLLLAVSFAFGLKVKQEQAALVKLQAKTADLEKKVAKYNIFKERKEEVVKQEEVIKKALDKQLFWHRLLNELSMVIPNNVSISKLDLGNDQISMSGFTFNHQGVAELLVRVSDLDELKDVWIDGSKDSELEEATWLGQSSSSGSSSGSSSSSSESSTVKAVEFTLTAKLKNPGPSTAASASGSASSSTGAQSSGTNQSTGSQ